MLQYDRFDELSDSFTESHYIEPTADGLPRIYTKIEGCIWFFCRTIERYAHLELDPLRQITAVTEPELSDAELSIERWSLIPKGRRDADRVPARTATRVLGAAADRHVGDSPGDLGSALDAAERIETLAQEAVAARPVSRKPPMNFRGRGKIPTGDPKPD